jgi:hypothetical protein
MPRLKRNASKRAKKARMHHEMGKFKRGNLHSGSKTGPVVTSREQAVAISLNESGQSRKPKRKKKSRRSRRS